MVKTARATTFDSQQRPIRLGLEVGRGGEGAVYRVAGRSDVVAKMFHKPLDDARVRKLSTMRALSSPALLSVASWPIDTLHAYPAGPISGVLVPIVQDRKPVHLLYSPKSRLDEFPNATWHFLVRTASNVARALSVIHQHGHVVGDVNEQNILVASDATVKLIDCDSYQVSRNGQVFTCDVGVPIYTPPELQGKLLSGIVRTQNHDAFGLAVLIFHLLFIGRHPFAGRFLGAGEMPIERAIREFRFAYGPSAASRMMRPPPDTLEITSVPESLARLFERSFSPHAVQRSRRPTSTEWVAALRELESQLVKCWRNQSHVYSRALASCPWCALLQTSNIDFFPSRTATVLRSVKKTAPSTFNLDAVWRQIASVSSPDGEMSLPDVSSIQVKPAPAAITHGQRRLRRRKRYLMGAMKYGLVPLLVLAGVMYTLFGIEVTGLTVSSLVLAVMYGGRRYSIWGSEDYRRTAGEQLASASRLLDEAQNQWSEEATDERFVAKHAELSAARSEYLQVKAQRERRIEELRGSLRSKALNRHLEQHRIVPGVVLGIGPSRVETLRSFGIETAADIQAKKVMLVPQFGPKLTRGLVDWRRNIEMLFSFDPKTSLSKDDQATIEREFGSRLLELEQKLRAGSAELRAVAADIRARRVTLLPEIRQRTEALAQAHANLGAL